MTAPVVAPPSTERAASLPRTLVSLKLRLLANRAKASNQAMRRLVIASIAAGLVGVAGAVAGFGVAQTDDQLVLRTVVVIGASLLTIGWAVLPLLMFGVDESLDPGRLALFPLHRSPLMRGLLAASFAGPAPAAAALVVLGTALGLMIGAGAGAVVVLLAMVLLLVLSAATARMLTTVLAATLSSRRGRDITVVVGAVLALSVQLVRFVHFESIGRGPLHTIDSVLRWFPPGMLGHAALDARQGHLALGAAELVPAALLIPLFVSVWGRALERSMTVVSDGETGRRRVREPVASPLVPQRLSFLSRWRWGAVTAKELRYVVREPRRKILLVNSVLIGAGVPIWFAVTSHGQARTRAVLLATLAGYVAVLASSNQFGVDGAAAWLDVVAGDTLRTVLVGKNMAVVLEVLPVVVVVGTTVAALTGGWVFLPGAILLGLAGIGAGLALANIVSVRFPIQVPDSRNPFASNAGGQGCATSAILGACAIAQNLLLIPVAIGGLIVAAFGPVWFLVVVPLSVAYGGLLWWGGLTVATSYGRSHQPEILERINPGRGA
jgi:ABC-2 type transport system permease protein